MFDNIVVSAVNHPDSVQPYIALYNKKILENLAKTNLSLDVVVPRPFAPPIGPYSEYSSIPRTDNWGLYQTHHPRFLYLIPKRIFYGLAGRSLRKRFSQYAVKTFDIPDVVHAFSVYPDGYAALPYCQNHNLPLVVTEHGPFYDFPNSVESEYLNTLQECTKVLCVSRKLKETVVEHVSPSKVELVPLGADPDQYPVDQEQRLREELNIPRDATVVLFVGQFIKRKGVSEIAEVLPNLDLANTIFVFVGHRGNMSKKLRNSLLNSKYPSQHIYTGITSLALRRWFVIADLFMLPSYAEGRPTVIYEAMAAKTAVLASNVDGIPEQVNDGQTGVLIPPKDPRALAAALSTLTDDQPRLQQMGNRGYTRLTDKKWTWKGHVDRLRDCYGDLLH